MAEAVFHEARGLPEDEMIYVANVVNNRVASDLFPNTVCKVVYQKSQFSWTAHKPNTKRIVSRNAAEKASWEQANRVATMAVAGQLPDRTMGALWYHTKHVSPSWSRSKKMKRVPVDHTSPHLFYSRR